MVSLKSRREFLMRAFTFRPYYNMKTHCALDLSQLFLCWNQIAIKIYYFHYITNKGLLATTIFNHMSVSGHTEREKFHKYTNVAQLDDNIYEESNRPSGDSSSPLKILSICPLAFWAACQMYSSRTHT